MAGDRGLALTYEAFRRGVIDFRRARVSDVRWWRRTNVILDAVARELEGEVAHAGMLFQLALVASGALTSEGWDAAQQTAKHLFLDFARSRQPWIKAKPGVDVAGARGLYKELVGDIDDPEYLKRVEEEMAAWQRERDAQLAQASVDVHQAVAARAAMIAEERRQQAANARRRRA